MRFVHDFKEAVIRCERCHSEYKREVPASRRRVYEPGTIDPRKFTGFVRFEYTDGEVAVKCSDCGEEA